MVFFGQRMATPMIAKFSLIFTALKILTKTVIGIALRSARKLNTFSEIRIHEIYINPINLQTITVCLIRYKWISFAHRIYKKNNNNQQIPNVFPF